MANGGTEPCPACEEKVIQNGDVAARVLDVVCEAIERHLANNGTFPHPLKLVEMANKLEDDAFAFQKEVLSQIGFKGPWPKSMA